MIRKHVESNGWYGDSTLEGDYVSLIRDSHIVVNGSRVELPPGQSNLLFLVCIRYNGQILIAGQGQSYSNWLYKDAIWHDLGPSFATFTCAFGSNNLYLVVGPNQYRVLNLDTMLMGDVIARAIGSNGIRYIDFSQSFDGIVTGDSTYGPQPYNLSQWCLRQDKVSNEDVVFGQSYIDGAVALYNSTNYLIEPGDTQFLRFYHNWDQVCFTIVKMLEKSTVFYWMDVADLKTFPIQFTADQKIPGPISNGIPQYKSLPQLGKKKMPLPTLDQWIKEEFPQLLAAYIKTQGHSPDPDFEWAAFQTYRRFMEPEAWPFDKMLRHELGDDSPEQKPNPQ